MVPEALRSYPVWRLNTGSTTSPSSLWSYWGWLQRGCSSSGLTPLNPPQNGVWTVVVCMMLLWSGYLWAALFLREVTWAVECTLALMCIAVDIIPRIKSRWCKERKNCVIDLCLLGWMSLLGLFWSDLLIVCVCLYTGVYLSSSTICGWGGGAHQQHWPLSRIQWPAECHIGQWFLHWWCDQSVSVHTLHWCVESELTADSWNRSSTGHAAQVNYPCLLWLNWVLNIYIYFLLH